MRPKPKAIKINLKFIRLWPLFLGIILCVLPAQIMAADETNNVLVVAVSILPQSFFVEKIGGSHVQVMVMVPPGANPATYEPKPRQLAQLSRCTVYFAQGVPFESAWLPRFLKANRNLKIVRCYQGVERVPMQRAPRSAKLKVGTIQLDPHIWLSPPFAFIEARNMLEGILRADPSHRESYAKGFRELAREIVDLDLVIKELFEGIGKHNSFMVYHPAWGYFARTYGLKQIAIEKEGKEPLARDLKRLVRYAKDKGFKELFIQPQVSPHPAHVIAHSIGAKLAYLDPLARQWDRNLLESAKRIRRALR